MKRYRREHKINVFSTAWTVGLLVLTFCMGLLMDQAHLHPASGLQNVVYVLIGLYGLGVVWFCEFYHKLLDERVRLRNAEAARLTGSVLAGAGMVALLLTGMGNGPMLKVDLISLFAVTYTVYLVSYFVLWFRSR